MTERDNQFLKIMYELTSGKKTISFTLYLEVFMDRLRLPLYNILCIYTTLADKGYIKGEIEERVILTEQARLQFEESSAA